MHSYSIVCNMNIWNTYILYNYLCTFFDENFIIINILKIEKFIYTIHILVVLWKLKIIYYYININI